jgi:flagellar biosynthesis/type III secretory pathway protein FliH
MPEPAVPDAPDADPAAAFDQLSAGVRGLVLGLVLGGAHARDPAAADRLRGADGAACRAALDALGALPRDERARCLARLARAASAVPPPGIERVHPGWLRAALEREATPILLAIADGLPPAVGAVVAEIVEARGHTHAPARDDAPSLRRPAAVDAGTLGELRRALFAPFVAMPDAAAAAAPGASPACRLASLGADELAGEIGRLGAEQLGASLHGAPPAVVARAAARLGEPAARIVLEAARAPRGAAERARARALVAAASDAADRALAHLGVARSIGLHALADVLADEPDEGARAVALRLPPALGEALLRLLAPPRRLPAGDPFVLKTGAQGAPEPMGRVLKSAGRVVAAEVVGAKQQAAAILAAAAADAARIRGDAERAHEEARRAGFEAGQAAGAAQLVAAAAEGERAGAEARAAATALAAKLAAKMAEKIVGRAVDAAPALLGDIAGQALAASRARGGRVKLRVHPDDVAALERDRARLHARLAAGVELQLVADAAVGRYGCVVETAAGRVDARLDAQLAVLEQALLARAPEPSAPPAVATGDAVTANDRGARGG